LRNAIPLIATLEKGCLGGPSACYVQAVSARHRSAPTNEVRKLWWRGVGRESGTQSGGAGHFLLCTSAMDGTSSRPATCCGSWSMTPLGR